MWEVIICAKKQNEKSKSIQKSLKDYNHEISEEEYEDDDDGADKAIRKDNKYKIDEYEDDNNLHQSSYSGDGDEANDNCPYEYENDNNLHQSSYSEDGDEDNDNGADRAIRKDDNVHQL